MVVPVLQVPLLQSQAQLLSPLMLWVKEHMLTVFLWLQTLQEMLVVLLRCNLLLLIRLHQLFHLSIQLTTKVGFQSVTTSRWLSPKQCSPSPLTEITQLVMDHSSYLQTILVLVFRCLLPLVLIRTRRLQLTHLIISHIPLLTRWELQLDSRTTQGTL